MNGKHLDALKKMVNEQRKKCKWILFGKLNIKKSIIPMMISIKYKETFSM